MSPRPSIFVALAAALLLSGCFFSQAPKFPAESAVAALGDGGRFQSYERTDADDSYKKSEVVTLTRRPDGRYDLIDEKGTVDQVSFHPMAGGSFVAQATESGKARYEYLVVRITGNEASFYLPDCAKQDKAQLEKLGVVIEEFECTIDRVADPAAFFASLKLSGPFMKLVRE
jgi:hypothetical protein